MFTIHTRQCPDYLSSSVQACSSDPARIRLRSATSINYSVARTRTKFGDRAFSVAGPVVWNSIPAAVREADTVSKLKTHFFLCASTMFDFDFCNALPVRARVGSGTITAIYYYYYYYYYYYIVDVNCDAPATSAQPIASIQRVAVDSKAVINVFQMDLCNDCNVSCVSSEVRGEVLDSVCMAGWVLPRWARTMSVQRSLVASSSRLMLYATDGSENTRTIWRSAISSRSTSYNN